jgi:uncharacterized membrane protein
VFICENAIANYVFWNDKRMKDNHQDSRVKGTISVVERNIKALIAQRETEDKQQTVEEKMAAVITRFTGSIYFIGLHVVIYAAWVVINVGWIPGIPRFDPTFVTITMIASIEGIFLAAFILITQRRMMAQADRRADLTLQISLLAEYEVTRLLTLTKELGKTMGVQKAHEPELEELGQDVAPQDVLEQLEDYEKRVSEEKSSS